MAWFSFLKRRPSGNVREQIDAASGEGPGFTDYSDWTLAMAKWLKSHSPDDLQRARTAIRKAISRRPCAKFFAALGQTEEMAQDYAAAMDAAVEAYSHDPRDDKLREWLGGHDELLAQIGEVASNPRRRGSDPANDEKIYTLLITFGSSTQLKEASYLCRAAARIELGRHSDASKDFKQVLKMNPQNADARAGLARLTR